MDRPGTEDSDTMTLRDGLRLPWRQRPTNAPERRAPDAVPPESPVARLWILGATAEREAELRLAAARVSDSLNNPDGLWIRDLNAAPSDPGAWVRIPAGDVLVAVPPQQLTDRLQRRHRVARRIRIVVPPYELIGSAHIPPGTDAAAYLMRHGRDFVALTHATLRREGTDLGTLPVVIVNLRAATQLGAPDVPSDDAAASLPSRSFA